jgi:hypothetical protein
VLVLVLARALVHEAVEQERERERDYETRIVG